AAAGPVAARRVQRADGVRPRLRGRALRVRHPPRLAVRHRGVRRVVVVLGPQGRRGAGLAAVTVGVGELADRWAIHDLTMQYWMNVDRRDWPRVKACFVPGT